MNHTLIAGTEQTAPRPLVRCEHCRFMVYTVANGVCLDCRELIDEDREEADALEAEETAREDWIARRTGQ